MLRFLTRGAAIVIMLGLGEVPGTEAGVVDQRGRQSARQIQGLRSASTFTNAVRLERHRRGGDTAAGVRSSLKASAR